MKGFLLNAVTQPLGQNLFCEFFNYAQNLPPPGSVFLITEDGADFFLTENGLDNFITE